MKQALQHDALISFSPLSDIVIIKPDAPEKVSKGGIHLVGTAIEGLMQGTVIASGEGRYTEKTGMIPNQTKPGDKVLYSKYANLAVKLDGQNLICLHEADIVGILE
jgi:chaperonin GroES